MKELSAYIATGIISFLVGLLLQYIEAKAKIIYWSPYNFLFELKNENIVLQTNSLTLQNTGRKSAENIEIIHKEKPDFFQLAPALPYQEDITSNNEHIIRVNTLGPKEFFMLQLLSYKTAPVLLNVRSKEGGAKKIKIRPQKIFPLWFRRISAGLLYIGLGFSLYWIIKAIIFISMNIGII